MALPWFRLYTEFFNDLKLIELPEKMKYRLIMLMGLHCEKDGNMNDVTDKIVSLYMKIDIKEVEKTQQIFRKIKVISKENWKLLQWEFRQFKSDNINNRVKKYRNKINDLSQNETLHETLHETEMKRFTDVTCNGNETPYQITDIQITDLHTPNTQITDKRNCAFSKRSIETFDKFWKAYPKKKSKGYAEKVFIKLKPDEELLDKILSAIEQAKISVDWTKENGKFIPHPATWLNARGWEDEINNTLTGGSTDDDRFKFSEFNQTA